jgi:ParB/RepB/Spo0J family partition protein
MKIKIDSIVIPERQRVDLGDINALASSLKAHGQAQPILVTRASSQFPPTYELVAGCRRLRAAQLLGWTEIECYVREDLTPLQKQLLELEEDTRRKDRTWQERCLATAKIHYIKQIESAENGTEWTQQQMADFTGISQASVSYLLDLAKALYIEPEFFATCTGYTDAIKRMAERNASLATAEMERRRKIQVAAGELFKPATVTAVAHAMAAAPVEDDPMPPLDLAGRAYRYNVSHPDHLPLMVFNDFLYGYWFLGGGNISSFYGSYSTEYLERIHSMFPDAKRILHLFSGSMPPGDYVRVGIDPTGQYKPDIEGDAEKLSSFLPFKPDLIYADPPYSVEDSEHYQKAMVNRAKVVSECAAVLQPGGFLVWLDQALPVFSNDEIKYVGCISYIRSTGNRFRCVCLFQKPI